MKPDEFMPFYGNRFFQAVEGQPDHVVTAYMRALWFYWHHAHGGGIRDDEAFLRRLTRATDETWDEVRAFVFDSEDGFYLAADGKWHQTFAGELWHETEAKYNAAVESGLRGAKKRWSKR